MIDKRQEKSYNLSIKNKGTEILRIKKWENSVYMEGGESFNTIFDDVFRTIAQKMPFLLIPLINEVFGTAYTEIRNLNSCPMSIMKNLARSLRIRFLDRRDACII